MPFHVIIPARYGSSRLPGKPLIDLCGKPMVQHVYERAKKSGAKTVAVATDDQRIVDAVNSFGGKVIMTSSGHESGTDRLQEVATKLGLKDSDIVVNVQGDEPLIPPAAIDQVAENLKSNSKASVATLCEPIFSLSDLKNPNYVKVVTDVRGNALYFSRSPIPYDRDSNNSENLSPNIAYYRHIGLYAYRVGLLHEFVSWPVGELEAAEKLEQLRIMENGHTIDVAETCESFVGGVDTLADVARVTQFIEGGQ